MNTYATGYDNAERRAQVYGMDSVIDWLQELKRDSNADFYIDGVMDFVSDHS